MIIAFEVSEAHARMGRMLRRLFRDHNMFIALLDAHIPDLIGLKFCSKFCSRPIDITEPNVSMNINLNQADADMRTLKIDWITDKLGRCAHCRRACRIGCLFRDDLQVVLYMYHITFCRVSPISVGMQRFFDH